MGLLLPEHVVRQVRAERMAEIALAHRDRVCEEFTRELKLIDPHLELVWWPENGGAPGFMPGRYHIVRHNPDASGSVEPVVGPAGEYREPDSSLFDLLRRSDMWNDRAMHDRKRMMQRALDAEAKRKAAELEEIREEARERWAAATETRVSMSRDVPWSQNVAGRRGAKP